MVIAFISTNQMLVQGAKYHKNGKVYTVIKITRERCINGTTTITLEDSCKKEIEVTEMQLVTHYSGFPSSTTINDEPFNTNTDE